MLRPRHPRGQPRGSSRLLMAARTCPRRYNHLEREPVNGEVLPSPYLCCALPHRSIPKLQPEVHSFHPLSQDSFEASPQPCSEGLVKPEERKVSRDWLPQGPSGNLALAGARGLWPGSRQPTQ